MINVQHSIETHHITVDRTALVVDDGLAIHAEARTFVLRTLIGIGRSIAVIGGVGHIVLVGVGTTEDVEVLERLTVLELTIVLEDDVARTGGAVRCEI